MTYRFLEPFQDKTLGKMENRVVMAPMSRSFAGANHTCTSDIAAYYRRRAKDGVSLIITEGIVIHPTADGYNNVPYLQTKEQSESWKEAVAQVQETGSKIFAQLWHCGRISHPDYTGGIQIVSSTNQRANGINRHSGKPFGDPRALEVAEIPGIFEMYMNAAENAFNAGFDGIQIHMGHGYLIDQFLDGKVNDRKDEYGGTVENKCRIAIELLELLLAKYGSEKVMIRISPSRWMGDLYEWPDLEEMLGYLIPRLNEIGLRLLDISCTQADYYLTSGKVVRNIRKMWPHFLMAGSSLTPEQADVEMEEGWLDMITWGRYILANPDFVTKISSGKQLLDMTDEIRAKLY
jgi:N-ethylmaleimide reductase